MGRDPRDRYDTVAYLAVVAADTQATAGDDARTAQWWPLNAFPSRLAFDHADILATATQNGAEGTGRPSLPSPGER